MQEKKIFKITLFGQCRTLVGKSEIEILAPIPATVGTILKVIYSQYVQLHILSENLFVAVNESYAMLEQLVLPEDEIAIFPPVSGGQDVDLYQGDGLWVQITNFIIEPDKIIHRVLSQSDGALATFSGVVRNNSNGRKTLYLEYEAYKSMALKMMNQVAQEGKAKWPISYVAMSHRLGRLEIGETSVFIAVSSPHRKEAFEACRFAIDRLKQIVPIWKHEYFEDGDIWVGSDKCT